MSQQNVRESFLPLMSCECHSYAHFPTRYRLRHSQLAPERNQELTTRPIIIYCLETRNCAIKNPRRVNEAIKSSFWTRCAFFRAARMPAADDFIIEIKSHCSDESINQQARSPEELRRKNSATMLRSRTSRVNQTLRWERARSERSPRRDRWRWKRRSIPQHNRGGK